MDLQDLRAQIEEVDHKMLKLLQKRKDLVASIGEVKKGIGLPIGNQELENQMLEKYTQMAEQLGVCPELVQNIFEEIFWDARRIQEEV